MWRVFVFFSADIGRIVFSCDVFYFDCTSLDLFTDCILTDLDVAEAFGGHVVGPLYASRVVIVDCDRAVNEFIGQVKVFEDIDDLSECFCAFVDCTNFSFSRAAAGSVCLAFGAPVEWAAEPYDVACDGAGFEEVEKDGRIVWIED
mmetsp:Transcript_25307/g.37481  ORF Transcript_25307/g.37481 Transcript_25307/m.37481 type:complete len:146 (+) Transcript_25307:134-571(+)